MISNYSLSLFDRAPGIIPTGIAAHTVSDAAYYSGCHDTTSKIIQEALTGDINFNLLQNFYKHINQVCTSEDTGILKIITQDKNRYKLLLTYYYVKSAIPLDILFKEYNANISLIFNDQTYNTLTITTLINFNEQYNLDIRLNFAQKQDYLKFKLAVS